MVSGIFVLQNPRGAATDFWELVRMGQKGYGRPWELVHIGLMREVTNRNRLIVSLATWKVNAASS